MTKTINFKLSKRLNDLGLLDNLETEYIYIIFQNEGQLFNTKYENGDWIQNDTIKTLTLEEAIEFCYRKINGGQISIFYNIGDWYIEYNDDEFKSVTKTIICNTLIEALEENIEYLLDNNLITNK